VESGVVYGVVGTWAVVHREVSWVATECHGGEWWGVDVECV